MIGLIGPGDSIALVKAVAEGLGLAPAVLAAAYQSPGETEQHVRSLGEVCPVILFTGPLPYSLAVAAGFEPTAFEYISYEGTDLFRVLTALALSPSYLGRIPRLSFDSIPDRSVAEAYAELGVASPVHVIPLEVEAEAGIVDLDRIIAAHRGFHASGAVEHCATCINAVYEALSAEGLPVTRVVHSRASIRQALLRAQLLLELDRAEASQVAVCVLRHPGESRPRVREILRECAARFGGEVTSRGDEEVIVTTRGAVERGMRAVSTAEAPGDAPIMLAIGTGATPEAAEALAREARDRVTAEAGRLIVLRSGSLLRVLLISPTRAREIRRREIETGRELELSSNVLRRIGSIFRELDPAGFTADEFARSYNVQPRSARRVIALLKARGLVQECGLAAGRGVGRPKHVYRILLDRMMAGQNEA